MRVLGMMVELLRSLFGWRRVDREIAGELQFHLDKQIEHYVAAGMSRQEARYAALREFGGVAQIQEECRDKRRVTMFRDLVQDVGYAFRGLRRDRGLALSVTLTLAICIGANTTMFSAVNSILIRPLPYPEPERIYWLWGQVGRGGSQITMSPDYYSLRESNRAFQDVAAFEGVTVNWTGIENPEVVRAGRVTASFFRVMGTPPHLGRYFSEGEEGPSAPALVILSYSFWQNRMGADRNVVGKTMVLNSAVSQIIGVMPRGFNYPSESQLWVPERMNEASQRSGSDPTQLISMVARARPGTSEQQVGADLEQQTVRIVKGWTDNQVMKPFQMPKLQAMPLQRRITGDLRPTLLALAGTVGLLLLIACANVANLLLARSASRQKEMAVRMALGSGRGRIVRQLLTESLTMAIPGGLAGMSIAFFVVQGLNSWRPVILARYPDIAIDGATLAFSLALTVLTGLIFGLAPALGVVGKDVQGALKDASHQQSTGKGARRLRQALVVVELGLSLILLIGAGLLARSFANLAGKDLGFNAKNLLTMRVRLRPPRYATTEQQVQFYDQAMDGIRHIPGVREVAITTDISLSSMIYLNGPYEIAGQPPAPMDKLPRTNISFVSRDYFKTLGTPLLSGRSFDDREVNPGSDQVIVNEALAQQAFAQENPIGHGVGVRGSPRRVQWTIMGVVRNIRGSDLGVEPTPMIYRCTCGAQNESLSEMGFIIRTEGDAREALKSVEAQIHAVDRNQPASDVLTMEERLSTALESQRLQFILIGAFAAVAVLLASLGVYGVMSYLVARRTRELGIRIAMGARPEQVRALVVGETFVLAAVAVVGGLAGAWALTQFLERLLYGVKPLDAVTFSVMSLVLMLVAVGASLIPAIRASRIDPIAALREE